jgi:hypothetical protein
MEAPATNSIPPIIISRNQLLFLMLIGFIIGSICGFILLLIFEITKLNYIINNYLGFELIRVLNL